MTVINCAWYHNIKLLLTLICLDIGIKKFFPFVLFFRVFTTVVSGLGEFFSPGREAKITTNYIIDVGILCV